MLIRALYPDLCTIFAPRAIACAANDHLLSLSCVMAEATLFTCRMRACYRARLELSDGSLWFSEGLQEEKQGLDLSWGSRRSTLKTNGSVLSGSIRESRSFFNQRYRLEFEFGPYRQACMQLAQQHGLRFEDRLLTLDLLLPPQGLAPLP
ncbi:MAG: hypothetical protein AB7T17_05535 [Geobacter sp.]